MRTLLALSLIGAVLLIGSRAQATTDPDTVALWLFDETSYPCTPLLDGTRNAYDLRLTPTGELVAGKYGNALRLSPGTNFNAYYSEWDGIVVASYMLRPWGEICGLWGPTITPEKLVTAVAGFEWTCEFWLKLAAAPGGQSAVLHFGYAYDPGFVINLGAGSTEFQITNAYAGWFAMCPITAGALTPGSWHHVAFTSSPFGNRATLYVDGQQQPATVAGVIPKQALPDMTFPPSLASTTYGIFDPSRNYERFRNNRFNISLGEDRQGGAGLDGFMDEVRVSSVVRYAGNFTPPSSLSHNYGSNAPSDAVANGPAILFGTNAPVVPVTLGSRRHLFVDNALIETTNNVQWKVNVPRIEPMPRFFSGDLNVVDHAGDVWFVAPDGYESAMGGVRIYQSSDGTNFSNPSLGIVDYQGSTNNNLVLIHRPMWAGAFKDTNPNVPEDERFKMTAWVANSGIELFTSGDLLHWRRNETMMLPLCSGGGSEAYWDDQNGHYKYFIKRDPHFSSPTCAYEGGRTATGFETRSITKEWPFQVLPSPYWAGWASPAVTCEGPVVFGTNSFGEVYRTRAIKYPWAPDVYLAFVWRLNTERVRRTELCVSRDGTNWTGLGAEGLYLPSGMKINNFTNGEAVMQFGLVRRGDSIWQYANFNDGNHDYTTASAFARLVQRLDGFVSIDSGASAGLVTTRPLVFSGSRLALNLDSHSGATRVALLDTNGVTLPGFALSDCDPISADSVNQLVTWHGSSSVAGLSGTPLRVQFQMTQTKLYALQFCSPGPVTVDTVEYWNGRENPHAIDGVTLSGAGTALNPFVYTIPSGMTITANGAVWLSSDLTLGNADESTSIKFRFGGGNLHIDAGGVISTPWPSRSGSMDFVLDMGGGSITGEGSIVGLRGPGTTRPQKPRDLTITNAVNVALKDIDHHTENILGTVGRVNIAATNQVVITGKLDASDTQVSTGNSAGNVLVKARCITINDVDTRALRSDGQAQNGSLELLALEPITGWSTASGANTLSNRLVLNGKALTRGPSANIASGGFKLYGVAIQFNPGSMLSVPANGFLDLRAGKTNATMTTSNLFVNLSSQNPTMAYSVTWNNASPAGVGPVFSTDQLFAGFGTAGVPFSGSIAGTATDLNGDALTYARGSGPAWLTVGEDGTLSGTPATSDRGTNLWTVSVSDGTRFGYAKLRIAVRTKPTFWDNPIEKDGAVSGGLYSGSIANAAHDLDGDVLTFAKESGPSWLTVAPDGGLSGTPGPADTFTNEWIVSVSDGSWTNAAYLHINVCGPPRFWSDPVIKAPAWTNENYATTAQTLALDAASPCGSPISFSKISGPGWLTVAGDGTLSGVPTAANLGTNDWLVSASDGASTTTATLRIVVPSPIVVTAREQWDGIKNPHAAQGVTLAGSGTTDDPAVYTIPTHLRLTSSGNIVMSTPPPSGGQDLPPDNSVVLRFQGHDLKLDANAYINIGRRARTGSKTANLSMGGGNILGAGQIRGILDSVSSPRVLTIEDAHNVSLTSLDLHVENVSTAGRNLNIIATGLVEIGSIDNSDLQDSGGDAGDVNISANAISVGTIRAFASRNRYPAVNNGIISLNALGAPGFAIDNAPANTIQNRLSLSGPLVITTGTLTNLAGKITLQGVVVELKPGFDVLKQSAAPLTINAGKYPNGVGASVADVFKNTSGYGVSPGYVVQWSTVATTTHLKSSANPACPGSPVNFTATVAAANAEVPTGAVQFTTNGVNFGSAVPLSSGSATSSMVVLPIGDTLVTAGYVGTTSNSPSVSSAIIQTVRANSAPLATVFSMGVLTNLPTTVQVIGGVHAPTDAEGDPLVVASVTQGSKGTVTTDGTNVVYTATPAFTGLDAFTYSVSDGCSVSVPATVTVSAFASLATFNQLLPTGPVTGGTWTLGYAGWPGYDCALEWATNLTLPVTWLPLATNKVGLDGAASFTAPVGVPFGFFRTRSYP